MKTAREAIVEAMQDAKRVYEENKRGGAGAGDYDSGRYEGLKQALQILDEVEK